MDRLQLGWASHSHLLHQPINVFNSIFSHGPKAFWDFRKSPLLKLKIGEEKRSDFEGRFIKAPEQFSPMIVNEILTTNFVPK
jgi:hypothetical protein